MKPFRIFCLWGLEVSLLDTAASAQVVLTDDAFTWSQTPKIKNGDSVALVVSQNANTYLKFSSGEWL